MRRKEMRGIEAMLKEGEEDPRETSGIWIARARGAVMPALKKTFP
jgi:hypothetical protein